MTDMNGERTDAVRAGWLVSMQSLVWTAVASTAAIVVGIANSAAALLAFGTVGVLDALGSASLVYRFHIELHHDTDAHHLERRAHLVVSIGLIAVGVSTIALDLPRAIRGTSGDASAFGIALAAVSLVVLAILSSRKRAIARRIPSAALRADGMLSGIGAVLAAITLVGTAATAWFGWVRADAIAAVAVGAIAVAVGVTTLRSAGG
jgi:divalent metal cation (Fe/Co/Zn/Cd) transporter